MRLFVAFELPADVHQALCELVDRLRRSAADVRWVRPEGLHLTLKFLGEQPEEKLPGLKEALRRAHSHAPVELDFRGVGCFPHARRPRVVWAGVRASDNLPELAAQVETCLEPLGIPRESRPYVPHLTLGRVKGQKGLRRLQEEVERLPSAEFGRARLSAFTLFQSRLGPQGARYTRLETFSFLPQ